MAIKNSNGTRLICKRIQAGKFPIGFCSETDRDYQRPSFFISRSVYPYTVYIMPIKVRMKIYHCGTHMQLASCKCLSLKLIYI